MRRAFIIAAVLVLLILVWVVAFTGTPLPGRKVALKDPPVSSIELSMSARHEINDPNFCAQVIQTMRKARDGGPVHAWPCLGTLIIHYADGTTNRFDFMPGHRFNRLDMADTSGWAHLSVGGCFYFHPYALLNMMKRTSNIWLGIGRAGPWPAWFLGRRLGSALPATTTSGGTLSAARPEFIWWPTTCVS